LRDNYCIRKKKDMNLIKISSVISGVFFAAVAVASAQSFTGSVGVQEDSSQTGAYTSSSLLIDNLNFTQPGSASGTFLSAVPMGTEVFGTNMVVSGLSTSPETVNINNFVVIGGAGHFGSTGTTPNDRFQFELQTLTENDSSIGYFTGTGILTDITGNYASTPATLLLSFSGNSNYSFTLQAVPEPATLSLAAVGFLGALVLRRRKN
jgi:hypothetical protein